MMQAKGGGSPDPKEQLDQKNAQNSSFKNGESNKNNPAVIVRKTSTSNHPVENYFLNEIAMSK